MGNEIHGVVLVSKMLQFNCVKNEYLRIYFPFFVPVVNNLEVFCFLAGPAGGRVQVLAN